MCEASAYGWEVGISQCQVPSWVKHIEEKDLFLEGFAKILESFWVCFYRSGWWFGTWFLLFKKLLGMSSSQLTHNFSEGLNKNHQPVMFSLFRLCDLIPNEWWCDWFIHRWEGCERGRKNSPRTHWWFCATKHKHWICGSFIAFFVEWMPN